MAHKEVASREDQVDTAGDNTEEWETASDESEENPASSTAKSSSNTACFSQRRNMPSRASKDQSLNKTKRRSIQKPSKRTATKTLDFSNLRPSDIKKIYMNKKLTNFRPTNLETIFEENDTEEESLTITGEESANNTSSSSIMGCRKYKRSLAFSDGFSINKTLIKQRRAKIKKVFGRRFALKKISLEDFMTQFKSNSDNSEETADSSSMLPSALQICVQPPSVGQW